MSSCTREALGVVGSLEFSKFPGRLRVDLRQTIVPEEFHNATVPPGFSVFAADVQNLAISNQ